ncbi:hypothetical protein Y1Q_0021256 [Alligator mississippiensis]|uniref:Uncharacterized protein n=1 Tax=Alligator mississippiensis TaxID=8496 RepID=A0A151MS30_ALLMI|nr:hypothetical protein Y1Q_0021256 [Alligator mississippiensis]
MLWLLAKLCAAGSAPLLQEDNRKEKKKQPQVPPPHNFPQKVVETPCHKNVKKVRRRDLPGDNEETTPSQGDSNPASIAANWIAAIGFTENKQADF